MEEPAGWCQARLNPQGGTTENLLQLAPAKYHAHLGDPENAQRRPLQVDNSDWISPDEGAVFLIDSISFAGTAA